MKSSKIALNMIVLFAMLAVFAVPTVIAQDAVYFVPQHGTITGGQGSNTTIEVWVNTTTGFDSWQTDIAFDSACVNITDVTYPTTGSWMMSDMGFGHFSNHIRMSNMRGSCTYGNPELIATLTVHCEAGDCTSPLNFTGTHFVKCGVSEITLDWTNGTVTNEASAVGSVYFVPQHGTITGGQGSNTTIEVWVNTTTGFDSWQTDIAFDSACVNITDVTYPTTGSWMMSDMGFGHFSNHIRMSNMRGSCTYGNPELIATLTVHCEAGDCTSPLNFTGTHFVKCGVSEITLDWTNGTVTNEASAVAPYLVSYTVTNRIISPENQDGMYDDTEIDIAFDQEVMWTIAIENVTGVVVYDWTGTSTNPNKETWNGRYGVNGYVPDGAYIVNITWENTTTHLSGINNTETIAVDNAPPASITNLAYTNGTTWINWTWTNPVYTDFNYTMVYLNGTRQVNTSEPFYDATGLAPDTLYEIGTRTVDEVGNINATWVNGTAKTLSLQDMEPPASITDLAYTNGTIWINWTWTNPVDAYFNYTMVYLNGTWEINTSGPFYTATGLAPDTLYEIGTRTVDEVGNINATWVNGTAKTLPLPDMEPPASITNLAYTNGTTWINWTWTNPPDADFNYTMVYLNGTLKTNTSGPFYNATGLAPDTLYEIGTKTVDEVGNINATWVNGTAKTLPLPDVEPPASITNLAYTNGTIWINWTWTNPLDADFNYTMVYLNGTRQVNTSDPFHNATGLAPDTLYEIGTKTVDEVGNINATWVNGTAKTLPLPDVEPPASITNLAYTNGTIWINWTWTNPLDADFNYTMVYLNGTWEINTSGPFYTATGLAPDTLYELGTRTVDEVGNINATWVNGTAKTLPVVGPPVNITDFRIENTPASRGNSFRARLNLTTTAATTEEWYVIVVSGTGPESEGIAGVGTVYLTPDSIVNNMPVLVQIPIVATTGDYDLIATVFTLSEYQYPWIPVTCEGPEIATVQ